MAKAVFNLRSCFSYPAFYILQFYFKMLKTDFNKTFRN